MSGLQISLEAVLLLLGCAWAQHLSQPQPPIVGGDPVMPNEIPMMASIVYEEVRSIMCGATIITQQHVVTAGHCVNNRLTSKTAIIVGALNFTMALMKSRALFRVSEPKCVGQPGSACLKSPTGLSNDMLPMQAFLAESFAVHPEYREAHYENDIAVVRIKGTMVFSESVSPVCLPFDNKDFSFAGSEFVMCGFGLIYAGGPKSDQLLKVTVDCISQEQCRAYESSLLDSQICTFTPGKDACQGDSGGPVLYMEPGTGRVILAGIISHGKSCASGDPGINTRVTSYLDWILSEVDVDYCRD